MKMRWLQKLSLTFEDPAIEKEFRAIQETNLIQDFDATAIALLLVTLSVVLERAVKLDYSELIVASAMTGALILFYLARRVLKKYIIILTIMMIAAYNVYRIIYLKVVYLSLSRVGLWSGGYTYAILHMILIYRVPNIFNKMLVVIVAYLFRFLVLIFYIDEKAASPYLLIRNIIVDCIIMYFYYTMERNHRRVFQYFIENRKELLKFKELLSDFPQSVTIIDFKDKKALFSNKTYLSTFETENPQHQQNIESVVTQAAHLNIDTSRPQLGSLRIDQASLGEIEALQGSCGSMELQNSSLYLKEVAEKLVKENLLKEQALTLTAAYKAQDQIRPFQVILKRVVWDRVDAVAVVLNDITDQQNLITLKIANSNKDKYISTVSHEFRTPLHGIIGLLEITEKETEKSEISKYISLCKDNAYLLLGMVNSILAFQQSTTGKLRLKLDRIEIRELLKNILRLFRFQSDEKKIYLSSEIADDVPTYIFTDEQRLKEIFIHLIGNAIKFTSKGGINIHISQDLDDHRCLQISVTDTGKGIREEELKDLFQFSWKMGVGETVNNKGVGLGLTVSNAWTLVLNGQTSGKGIQVTSEYEKGSCFSFKILKELRVITNTETNITMRKLNSEGYRGTMERQDEIEVGFSPRIPEGRGLEKPILADLSDKGQDSEYYEELLSPADLETKLSIYISRNKTNIHDLNFQFRHSKSYIHEMMELKTQQKQRMYENQKSAKGDIDEEASLKPQSRCNSPQRVRFGTVLVVDDNPFNLLIASNILKDLGYQVRTALGGREAIEEAKACSTEGVYIKLILMDCQMPIIDGYETTRILRSLMNKNEIQRAPILAWTANDSQEDVDRCFECGMIGHLTKPTSKDSLLKALIRLE